MKTIFDVIKENVGAAVVLVHRHYSYLSGPTANRAEDEADLFARNYSEQEPSVLFLCDKAGIEKGWQHGKMFAEAGIKGVNIIASHQGRGPDTGLRISEGYHEATGEWLPVSCHRAVDYPLYNYLPARKAIAEDGNPMTAKWLNGQRPDQVRSDSPSSFKGRVIGFITDLLKGSGITLITTHFEICVLVHTIYVAKKDLGEVPEKYEPQRGGGVIIVKKANGKIVAYDYDSDLNVIP